MLLHPEILTATAAERDRSRRPSRRAARPVRRHRTAARTCPRRSAAALDGLRAGLAAAILGRGRARTR
jgi:hypothetical protein